MAVVVVVVEAGICRFDFRANLMHGRRGRRLVAGSGRRSDEKLRRRRLQLEDQLVRLSGRRFTWQLHRKIHTATPPRNPRQQQPKTKKKLTPGKRGKKNENQRGDTTHRRALPKFPHKRHGAMCVCVFFFSFFG